MKKYILPIIFAVLSLVCCTRKVAYTTVEIKDPVRHYYPILQGQELSLSVRLDNTGKVPLVIKDVQPSCGCILMESRSEKVIPPGKSIVLGFKYDSRKNVGKVEHVVRFWGNISPKGMAEMRFDVNVVPDALYHHDYEELYDKSGNKSEIKEFVDGEAGHTGLGYYVDR